MGRKSKAELLDPFDVLLPSTKDLSYINITGCEYLAPLNVPQELRGERGYTRLIEGQKCSAVLKSKQKKYFINKDANQGMIKQARIFCNKIRYPRNDADYKQKRADLKAYYEHNDVWEYSGKTGESCKVVMTIVSPTKKEKDVIYTAEFISINRPIKE